MNSHQWLYQATQDMPEVVAQRVTAETLAHLQEAGLSNAADVLPLLGDPEETAQGLRRLYLTNKEWLDLQTGGNFRTGLNLSEWLAGLVVPMLLLFMVWDRPTTAHLLILAAYLLMLAVTQRLHSVRRRHWRLWSLALLVVGLRFTDYVELFGSLWLTLVLLLGLVAYGSFKMLRQDSRLRRTLALDRGSA